MTSGVVLTALLAASTGLFLQAEQQLRTLNGSCSIAATANEAEVDLRLESAAVPWRRTLCFHTRPRNR